MEMNYQHYHISFYNILMANEQQMTFIIFPQMMS